MYGVQNIVAGEVKDVHVVRLQFYTDKELEMTAALRLHYMQLFPDPRFLFFVRENVVGY